MSEFPFGKTEEEHNKFCDSMKCKYGNYCNFILGKCPKCQEEYEHQYGEKWEDPRLVKVNKDG